MKLGSLFRIAVLVLVTAPSLVGCVGAADHRKAVQDPAKDRLSAGIVQREVRVGMTGAEVAEVLGSPNVVSTDEQQREVWIYDRISTEASYSRSSGFGTLLLFGSSSDADASSRNQRALTIIVKFDDSKRVRDVAYRQSSF